MTTNRSSQIYKWSARNQYFAAISANLIILAHGAIIGWVSPALPILSSENTPLLSGPLTNEQVSWIGSINCIGAMCGTISLGYFISCIGCKRAMLILTMPCAVFWILIYFGNSYYHILIARLFSGYAGGGIQTSLILYVSEIANDDIRGRLGSSSMVTRNIGILMGYVFGATLEYSLIACISITLPIIFLVCFTILPNTPQFHLSHGQVKKAEYALKFYKNYRGKSAEEDIAMDKEFERLKAIACERRSDEKVQLADFYEPRALKGISIGIALTTLSQLTANFTITNYAVMIFEKAGSQIDPYVSSIALALSLLLGALFTTYLADILGRKMLNVSSLLGSAAGLFALSLYHYLNLCGYDLSAFVWLPIVSLSTVIFLSAVGIVPLSMVCSVEYLPPKIRTYGMAIICFSINVVTFICVKLFPILLEVLDLHGVMLIFAISCILGAIFVLFVVEETTGKSLDDVGSEERIKMERIHAARINSL